MSDDIVGTRTGRVEEELGGVVEDSLKWPLYRSLNSPNTLFTPARSRKNHIMKCETLPHDYHIHNGSRAAV